MPLSADQFAKAVINAGLSSAEEIKSIWSTLPAGSRPKDGETFSKVLIEREKLTQFQASEILSGSATPLLLGDYELLAKIGAGGMGQVFKARHRHMDRLAAIKLLPAALTKDAEAVKRFQREVKAAAKLSHPNIVQTYDAGVQRGVWYLVMEYVDGRDLAGVVTDAGPLPIDQAVEYIRQAAQGLAFAHENGVVHRDIKPANLLLDKKGSVKILDMGLARFDDGAAAAKDGLTQSGQVMGTIDYMAPEQAFDTRHADARADIYSLGCTLFRLLTGANLFEGDTLVKKLMAHQQEPAPDLSQRRAGVPRELDAIFKKMVAKKPEDRYQTMAEVQAALAAYLSKGGTNSPTASLAPGGTLSKLLRSFSGQGNQAVAATAGGATLARPDALTTPASGDVATMALANPLQGTDPLSQRSVQVVRDQRTLLATAKKPPLWRQPRVLAAGGLGGALLLLLGIWVIIRDKDGNEVGRMKVPDGGKAEIVGVPPSGGLLPAKAGTPATAWHNWPADAPKPAIAPFDAPQAKKHQEEWAGYLKVPVEYTNSIGMKFVLIPPGEFTMGSTDAEIEAAVKHASQDLKWMQDFIKSEAPQHKVILTQPIYMGVTEVTQGQYQKVTGTNPSHFSKNGPEPQLAEKVAGLDTTNNPVEGTSWNDAAEFCDKLSQQEKLKSFYSRAEDTATPTGNGYRLPTEAQWEFTCRAGTTTKYWLGDEEEKLLPAGWFGGNSGGRTHPVGELKANPFGVHDMHGNVYEWVQDGYEASWYSAFKEKAAVNPVSPFSEGSQRVNRGGVWYWVASGCRSSGRNAASPTVRVHGIGFRVSLPIEAVRGLKTLDLLALTDPKQDRTRVAQGENLSKENAWQRRGRSLVYESDGGSGLIKVPVAVSSRSYQIEVEFERLSGNARFHIDLPLDYPRIVPLVFDSPQIKMINTTAGDPWPAGRAARAKVVARLDRGQPDHLTIKIDGRLAVDWQGNIENVAMNGEPHPEFPGRAVPSLYSHGGSYEVGAWSIRIFDGDATALRSPGANNNQGASWPTDAPKQAITARKLFMHDPAFPQWVKDVQAMPAQQQLEAVSKKLVELNPGFDGKLTGMSWKGEPEVEKGEVKLVGLEVDHVVDLSPVRAFPGLRSLGCRGSSPGKGTLSDLSPLKGLPLGMLFCVSTPLSDLTPLVGMKLKVFHFSHTEVSDLSPLKGMPLESLNCVKTKVSDLSLIHEFNNLTFLSVRGLSVSSAEIAALQKALPNCTIEWDDPTKESTTSAIPAGSAPPPAIAPFDAAQAKKHQEAWAAYLKVPVEYTNSIGMKFRLIPPGEFLMGVDATFDPATMPNALDYMKEQLAAFKKTASPQHQVRLTRPFYLQVNEVNNGAYQRVMGESPEKNDAALPEAPVMQNISLRQATAFCNVLSKAEKKSVAYKIEGGKIRWKTDADGYRLPTEAEWEFACRAGTTTHWYFGNDTSRDGQATARLKEYQSAVAGKQVKANPFGIIDQYGGTAEWCFDRAAPYAAAEATDPFNEPENEFGVSRGGSNYSQAGTDLSSINSWARSPLPGSPFSELWHGLGRLVLPIPLPEAAKPTSAASDGAADRRQAP